MEKKDIVVIFLASILLLFMLVLIPKHNLKKQVDNENNIFTTIKDISKNESIGYIKINDKRLSNGITNLVYKSPKTGKIISYFIDSETGKIVDFKSIFKEKFYKEYFVKEEELLKLKYPKFIADDIISSKTVKREYIVDDNQITVYYYNILSKYNLKEDIYLIINNNELSKYLNYDFVLDEEYTNEDGNNIDLSKKYIAFTFDDGPNKNNTQDIVDALNDNKMSATFFMVGNLMEKYPHIVNYVYENNMEIGSHSYAHSNLKRQKEKTIEKEMKIVGNLHKDITDTKVPLFRPPYGSLPKDVVEKYKYSYILWSVDTNDWRYKDSVYISDYIINNVNDGDIVLMHDLFKTTKDAVIDVLPKLYLEGYRVVSVSKLAEIKNVKLEANKTYRSMK